MSLTLRLPVIILALALLQLAGCVRNHCRLRTDHETLQASANQSAFTPASMARPNASSPVEIAADDTPLIRGESAHSSGVRPAAFQQAQELPDQPQKFLPPPPAGASGEQQQELPSPYYSKPEGEYSPAAAELIVVPVPPPPPGWVKRLLNSVGCARFLRCAPDETAVPLAIETQLFSSSGEVCAPNRWWTSFGDAGLNRQVEHSLSGSFTLAAALQRLFAAEALARREASDLWPDLNGFGEAEGVFRSFAPADSFFAMGLDASYQVDLWGQIQSRVEAERLRAAATEEDYHAVALTLSAEIART